MIYSKLNSNNYSLVINSYPQRSIEIMYSFSSSETNEKHLYQLLNFCWYIKCDSSESNDYIIKKMTKITNNKVLTLSQDYI